MSVLIKIGDQWHKVSPVVADELKKVRRELRDAQIMLGLLASPEQEYYAGTPVFEVMNEVYQLRAFRKRVEEVLANSTEYFEWNDAIESLDRVRKLLVPILAEIKKPEEQT